MVSAFVASRDAGFDIGWLEDDAVEFSKRKCMIYDQIVLFMISFVLEVVEDSPLSVSVNVTERVTADTTFSAGIIDVKSNCSATVSTVALIIYK